MAISKIKKLSYNTTSLKIFKNRRLTATQKLIVAKMIAESYPKGDLAILVTEAIALIEKNRLFAKPIGHVSSSEC